ncbi:MAG: BatA domain-containing protein [Lentisphaeria bacterium]|nr:BatA domain-containing protein [Lentisphaeria bacterium]
MIAFLTPLALVGLAALSWPLYLHLRKRRSPREVVVPSLLLFEQELSRARKRNLTELLLLLCRLLTFAALALLLARPFVKTRRRLPLPLLGGEQRVLAVVMDNGIETMARYEGRTRFEWQRDWLAAKLQALPPHTAVAFVTTTQPVPPPLVTPDRALRQLGACRPTTVSGSVLESVAAVRESCEGRQAALVVVGSRSPGLWPQGEGFEGRVAILDTTGRGVPGGILRAEREGNPPTLSCRFFGPADAHAGRTVTVSDGTADPVLHSLRSDEALTGQVRIPIPTLRGQRLRVRIGGGDGLGVWDAWYTTGMEEVTAEKSVVVYHGDDDGGVLGKQFLSAILQSKPIGGKVYYVPESASVTLAKLPTPDSLAVVGLASLTPEAGTFLRRSLADGARVLIAPSASQGELASLSWTAPSKGLWRVDSLAPEADRWFDTQALSLSGLVGMGIPRLHSVRMPSNGVVLASAAGAPVVLGVPVESGRLFALAFPLDLETNSPVFHPVFPHLLHALLYSGGSAPVGDVHYQVGQSLDVADLPGKKGGLTLPDGSTTDLGADGSIFLELPGFYTLTNSTGVHVLVVNTPRPPLAVPLPQSQWNENWPQLAVRWLDEGVDLGSRELYALHGEREAYDLSALAALALVAGLVLEALLLLAKAFRNGRD